MDQRQVSVEREVDAPAAVVFEVLADPRMHPDIDGSDTLRGAVRGPQRLSLGARFGMRMTQFGVPYVTPNTVIEFEEGRRIAWHHPARHRWRWELEPLGDPRTLVRHTFDYAPSITPWLLEWFDVPSKHEPSMRASLDNLAAIAEVRALGDAG